MTSPQPEPSHDPGAKTAPASCGTWQIVLLTLAVLAVPVLAWAFWPAVPHWGQLPEVPSGGTSYPVAPNVSFHKITIGPRPVGMPKMCNVRIVDFDNDGTRQILACDADRNAVLLYRSQPDGSWNEQVLAEDLVAPAHATLCDLDSDGRQDVLVAVLGQLEPSDEPVGRVVWLQGTDGGFEKRLILDDVRRVADVQVADFDGDGDLDPVVACFGYSRGEICWLENRGDGGFREHVLHSAPGTIHVPVADFDSDGKPDFAAIVTQDEEEIWIFRNLGGGAFEKQLVHRWFNYDLGGAGLIAADLDSNGLVDLISPVGDNLEDLDPYPQPYHGCFWFENLGNGEFRMHRIAELGGTYAAAVGDLNGDGYRDVVLVSMANNFREEGHASMVWLENDGQQNFKLWEIAEDPTHLVTLDCGDLNADGRDDIVAAGLHLRAPYTRIGRITGWINGEAP